MVRRDRMAFVDGLRGLALVFMVLNHTGRWWLERPMGWPRYYLVYATLTLAAPLFLFLVGFSLALSVHRTRAGGGCLGWPEARKHVRRGAMLIAGGWLLNIIVFPEDAFYTGGVLQTIGLSLVAVTPVLFVLHRRPSRHALAGLAVLLPASLGWAYPALRAWLPDHPVLARVWFFDIPIWPWLGLVLLGTALGAAWVERETPAGRRRYMVAAGAAGAGGALLFVARGWWTAAGHPVLFGGDYSLNGHWIPRGVTNAWILGMVLVWLALAYQAMEIRGWRAAWLVTLGRSALPLYFAHQVIALTVVSRALGWRFTAWWAYAAANALLIVLLIGLGRLWLALRSRWRARGGPSRAPAPA